MFATSLQAEHGVHAATPTDIRIVPQRRSAYTPRGRSSHVSIDGARHGAITPTSWTLGAAKPVAAVAFRMGLGR